MKSELIIAVIIFVLLFFISAAFFIKQYMIKLTDRRISLYQSDLMEKHCQEQCRRQHLICLIFQNC